MSDHLIVIPVFNEVETLEAVVRRARRHGCVLVVDDGSSDASVSAAARAGADVVRLGRRRGKGAALGQGFAEALARGAERVVTLDGDGQHDPDEIPGLLAAAASAPDALVIGGRLGAEPLGRSARGEGAGVAMIPLARLHAMRVAGFFINWLSGVPLRDTQSGFRVYPLRLLAEARPRHGGFVFETEMLLLAAAMGLPLIETPIRALHFQQRRSRFRPGRDGLAVGAYLAGHALRRWGREARGAAAALARPFTAEGRRPRHQEMASSTAPYRYGIVPWAIALAAFIAHRTVSTWGQWWRDPRGRALRVVGIATVATPCLLALTILHPLLSRLGLDLLSPFVRGVYSQERLARALGPAPAAPAPLPPDEPRSGEEAPTRRDILHHERTRMSRGAAKRWRPE